MQVNKDLPMPLYYQVQKILEEKILSDDWKEGTQIPTEKELAQYYNVSNITIKRAIHELVSKGLIYRIRGKGTFVASTAEKRKNLFNLITFENQNETRYPHQLLHSSIEKAEGSVAKKLCLEQDEYVFNLLRLKLKKKKPVALEYSYIVHALCPHFSPESTEHGLIYHTLERKHSVQLQKAKVYFSGTVADQYQAGILEIEKGDPLIELERVTCDSENRPVEYSKFVVRQDQADYYFEVNLK